ncbi:MAG: DnaJ domain-containing protein [Pseudomonadota bacterium]
MIAKLLAALAVAWLGWRLWHGFGPNTVRAGSPVAPPRPPVPAAEEEARAVLGVGPDADADAIRAAHRRLIAAVHPDHGGSPELARQINAARDLLLKAST